MVIDNLSIDSANTPRICKVPQHDIGLIDLRSEGQIPIHLPLISSSQPIQISWGRVEDLAILFLPKPS